MVVCTYWRWPQTALLASPVAWPLAPPASLLSLPRKPKAPEAAPEPHCAPTSTACCRPGLLLYRSMPGVELPAAIEKAGTIAPANINPPNTADPINFFIHPLPLCPHYVLIYSNHKHKSI